jgi:hypothetical protein
VVKRKWCERGKRSFDEAKQKESLLIGEEKEKQKDNGDHHFGFIKANDASIYYYFKFLRSLSFVVAAVDEECT